jgi:hypothetical protein
MNPNLSIRRAIKKAANRWTTVRLKQSAQATLQSAPPLPGERYPTEKEISKDFSSKAGRPYFLGETIAAAVLAVIGICSAISAIFFLGVTYMSLAIAVLGIVFAIIGVYVALFKPFPRHLDPDDVDTAYTELSESGEDAQKNQSLVWNLSTASLCFIDGALVGFTIAERAGQTILSPRSAMFVGLGIGIVWAVGIWKLIELAAAEHRRGELRKMIRVLQEQDPDKANAMIRHVGSSLQFSYGAVHNSRKCRIGLLVAVTVTVVVSFGLRWASIQEAQLSSAMVACPPTVSNQ